MITRVVLFCIFLAMMTTASAAERFQLNFELTQGEKTIERGVAFITQKPRTWYKGLQRSYLKLRCQQQESGKTQKLYSTEGHFAGLRVTHQLTGDSVELTVVHSEVQARLTEIRALAKSECKDLSPIVTTTKQTYSLLAKDGMSESHDLGENMAFRVKLQSIEGKR
jgi:hypothetical protein